MSETPLERWERQAKARGFVESVINTYERKPPEAITPKAVYGEAPTGPYATLLRDVYDILKRTPYPETRFGLGVEVARTEAIDKVITAYETKTITRNELESLLEEISPERFGRMTYGELNDFLLYWRGRFKPGATAVRAAKPMTEDEFNKFFEATAVK